MGIFIVFMMVGGTVQSLIVVIAHLLYGQREGRQFGHRVMYNTFSVLLPLLFGKVDVEGLENLPKTQEDKDMTVYVSNHQSTLDFALYYAMPADTLCGICAVAKSSIMYMPGFGWMTMLCGGIMIKRGKKGTMTQMLEAGRQRVGNGINIGMFPQGTRGVPSETIPPIEIKKGFAVLAAELGRPVVPMTFLYDDDIMSGVRRPDGSTPGIKVIVHPQIHVKKNDDAIIAAAVRETTDAIIGPILAKMPPGTDKVWEAKLAEQAKKKEEKAREKAKAKEGRKEK
jgi:1-acyl-sn-glycerol-3-phosphate acyltransferase